MTVTQLVPLLLLVSLVAAQNECYAAADKRIGSSVVPCGLLNGDSHSACCYSGDLCLRCGAPIAFDYASLTLAQ